MTKLKKLFAMHTSNKGLLLSIPKETSNSIRKTQINIRNERKIMQDRRVDMQTANRYVKILQNQTHILLHTNRKTKIKRQRSNTWSNWNSLTWPVNTQISVTLEKTLPDRCMYVYVPVCGQAWFCMHPNQMRRYVHKKIYTRMFTAALFITDIN